MRILTLENSYSNCVHKPILSGGIMNLLCFIAHVLFFCRSDLHMRREKEEKKNMERISL